MKVKLIDDPFAVSIRGPKGTAIFLPWGPNQGYYARQYRRPNPTFRQLHNIPSPWSVEPPRREPGARGRGATFHPSRFFYSIMALTGREDRYITVCLNAAIQKIPAWARAVVLQLPEPLRLLGLSWLNRVGPEGIQRLLTAPAYCLALLAVSTPAQRLRLGRFAAMSRKKALHAMAPRRLPLDVRQTILRMVNDPEDQNWWASFDNAFLKAAWLKARSTLPEDPVVQVRIFMRLTHLGQKARAYKVKVEQLYRPVENVYKYLEKVEDTIRLAEGLPIEPDQKRELVARAFAETPTALARFHTHLIERFNKQNPLGLLVVPAVPEEAPDIEDGALRVWRLDKTGMRVEGVRMRNCVASYVGLDDLEVYHAQLGEEGATLGLRQGALWQLYGPSNHDCSTELWRALARHFKPVASRFYEKLAEKLKKDWAEELTVALGLAQSYQLTGPTIVMKGAAPPRKPLQPEFLIDLNRTHGIPRGGELYVPAMRMLISHRSPLTVSTTYVFYSATKAIPHTIESRAWHTREGKLTTRDVLPPLPIVNPNAGLNNNGMLHYNGMLYYPRGVGDWRHA